MIGYNVNENALTTAQQNAMPAIVHNDDIMSVITRFASDPNFDVVKLEKLMDLNERMLNRSAKEAFAADFVRMKPMLPKVVRTKSNNQTKSMYAPLDDINQTVDPILAQYGFGTSAKIVSQTDKTVTVKAELWHSGGHTEETTITMPLDDRGIAGTVNKTLPHAISSSITYIKRIAICALLNISTGDDRDGNTSDDSVLPNDKAVEIDLLIRESGADRQKFLDYMGVDDVRKIQARNYAKAKGMLLKKKAEGAGK